MVEDIQDTQDNNTQGPIRVITLLITEFRARCTELDVLAKFFKSALLFTVTRIINNAKPSIILNSTFLGPVRFLLVDKEYTSIQAWQTRYRFCSINVNKTFDSRLHVSSIYKYMYTDC